jgi:excisionase family DNA binding protein
MALGASKAGVPQSERGHPSHMKTIVMPAADGELHEVKGYSLREAAGLLGLHPDTVRRRVREGLWPHVVVGRAYYFSEEQVQRIVEARTHEHTVLEPGVQ